MNIMQTTFCALSILAQCVAFTPKNAFTITPKHQVTNNNNNKSISTKRFVSVSSSSSDAVASDTAVLEPEEKIDIEFQEKKLLMPEIVQKVLIDQDVTNVDPFTLLDRLDISNSERIKAQSALERSDGLITVPNVLKKHECEKLISFLRKKLMLSQKNKAGTGSDEMMFVCDDIDDVDGCLDWQVNIHPNKLVKLLGKDAYYNRLLKVPNQLLLHSKGDDENNEYIPDYNGGEVGIFLRMYKVNQGRPWLPFHADQNSFTVNIALNSDEDYENGKLLALHDNKIDIIERKQGDATCHSGNVFHAVSAMRGEGTRYSMIMFFHDYDGMNEEESIWD